MSEQKTPYFSKKVHIGELSALKTLGIKTRSVEITMGNQEKIILNNPQDVAEIVSTSTIGDIAWEVWEDVTSKGHAKGHKFAEDIVK